MTVFPSTQPVVKARENVNRWFWPFVIVFTVEVGLLLWRVSPHLATWITQQSILPVSEKLAWYLTRSSGTVAYLTLTFSTIWGLLLSTKLVKAWVPAPLALVMHNWLAWISIGLSCFHAIVLLFDNYYTYTITILTVPFTGPYRPLWVGVGTIGFYLLLITSASFYARRWIGAKGWRRLHYVTFLAFFMVTLHGWQAGTDSAQLQWVYLGSSGLVLFLTFYRIIDALQQSRQKRTQTKTAELYTLQLQ